MHSIRPYDGHRHAVFLDRYALKRPDGRPIETKPEEMMARVCKAVAKDTNQAKRFLGWMEGFAFLPGGRVLAGAGAKSQSTLYNCFVIGPHDPLGHRGCDSRAAIMGMMSRMVEINARGGGVGINWSVLRPDGARIRGVDGTSSGPIGWMEGADALSNQIRQGGSRTAALMFMLNDWHPDILDFVSRKKRFKRANSSVAISDEFMECLSHGGMWHTLFPRLDDCDYDREWNGDTTIWHGDVAEYDSIPSSEIWSKMSETAHAIGSPGVVFLDRCQRMSNTWYRSRVAGTNPCGEQPLPEDGCCNLGSINLVAFWDEKQGSLDWDLLRECVRDSVEFLDRVIDVSIPIDDRISAEQTACRRVGLGAMGLADVLILYGDEYGSVKSRAATEKIYHTIRNEAYEASIVLAGGLGKASGYDKRLLESGFAKTLPEHIRDGIAMYGIRNLTLLTQAPAGTTSTLAGVSSGIEPVFAGRYTRSDATGNHRMEHPLAGREAFVTALNITPEIHVSMQAVVQGFVDSSVSKTVNLPEGSSPEEIARIYRMAYAAGCKGITVYRDKSAEGVFCEECRV